MQKRISDYTDRSRTCRRPYLKSITGYQEDIGRTNDGGACLTLFYMKTVRQLTLTFITALFVVTTALLWASASPKVSAQTRSTFAFAPGAAHRPCIAAGPLAFLRVYFKRRGEDSIPGFRSWFRPEFIRSGRPRWRWRPRHFGRRQLFWLTGYFRFEKQRQPNFCRASLLLSATE